jgi:hypothetical protein
MQQTIRDASVRMIKPNTDLALARDAMGVDKAMAARADKATAAGAGAKAAPGARPAH